MAPFKRSKKQRVWKSVALGMTGGLAGSWLMNQSQTLMQSLAKEDRGNSQNDQQTEPATVITAQKLSKATTGSPLPPEKKKTAEPIVHYAFGALVGGLYGGLAEKAPVVTMGAGALYGAAVWLLADEVAVPAFGLSKPPQKTPLSKHLQALGAHFVYGLTTEGVRRAGAKLAS